MSASNGQSLCGSIVVDNGAGAPTPGAVPTIGPANGMQLGTPITVPAAGSALGNATAMIGGALYKITSDGDTKGVKFDPALRAGESGLIYNSGSNATLIYPAATGTINGGSTNAPVTFASGISGGFTCLAAGSIVITKSA